MQVNMAALLLLLQSISTQQVIKRMMMVVSIVVLNDVRCGWTCGVDVIVLIVFDHAIVS